MDEPESENAQCTPTPHGAGRLAMRVGYTVRRARRPFMRRFTVMDFVLYQRDDCALCDRALALLAAARAPEFASVWIDDDDTLEARYGARVPVLRDERDGRELDWPFDAGVLAAFLRG
jgi:hypothetical protein